MKRLICTFYLIAGVLAISANVFGQPAAPLNLTAVAVSINQIDLSWQHDATTEDRFEIERKIGAASAYSVIGTVVAANTTIYSDFGLAVGTIYFYRVRAYNDDGYSAYSNEANATTLPNPPAAPSSLTATAVSNSQINLTWQDNATDETGFTIERLDDDDYIEIATLPANATSYSDVGLAASTNYYYRVLAINDYGDSSAYSNEINATTFNPAPTLVSLSPTNGNRLQTLAVVFTGKNFIDGVTSVNADVTGITVNSTIVNSATSLTANITIAAGAATGAQNFSVTNSDPGGGTSTNQTFTVKIPFQL